MTAYAYSKVASTNDQENKTLCYTCNEEKVGSSREKKHKKFGINQNGNY